MGKICYSLNKAEEKALLIELGKTISVLLNCYGKQVTDNDLLERLFSDQYELVDSEQTGQSDNKVVSKQTDNQPSNQQEDAEQVYPKQKVLALLIIIII